MEEREASDSRVLPEFTSPSRTGSRPLFAGVPTISELNVARYIYRYVYAYTGCFITRESDFIHVARETEASLGFMYNVCIDYAWLTFKTKLKDTNNAIISRPCLPTDPRLVSIHRSLFFV